MKTWLMLETVIALTLAARCVLAEARGRHDLAALWFYTLVVLMALVGATARLTPGLFP